MSKSVEKDELLDHLLCPVCFEVPEAEVYQCRDGHMVCHKCYFKCVHCPQCRDPFDIGRPIRCRPFEELLARCKIQCPFNSNGCNVGISKDNLKSHVSQCPYDFKKFGELVQFCKKIGYTECISGINNGNTEAAVKHFVSKHKCFLTNSEVFKINLRLFSGLKGDNYWTPVIADLGDHKCFLMTVPILSKFDAGFTLLPIFLPYVENEDKETCPVEGVYTLQTKDSLDGESFIMYRNPVSIGEANKMLINQMQFIYNSKALSSYCSPFGNLSFKCKIKPVGVFRRNEKTELESFECYPYFKRTKTAAANKLTCQGFNFWDGSKSFQSTNSKTGVNKLFIFGNSNAINNSRDTKNVPVSGETLKKTVASTSQDQSKLTDSSTTKSAFGSKDVLVSTEVPVEPLILDKDSNGGSDNTSTSGSSVASGAPSAFEFPKTHLI